MPTTRRRNFKKAIARGRRFEKRERPDWDRLDSGTARFEAPTVFDGRRGRIDIRVEESEDYVSIVELKATDWDRIRAHRRRPTALRHARQVWQYARVELASGIDVCAGIIYERAPRNSKARAVVEQILNERLIQVVWRTSQLAPQHAKNGADAPDRFL